MFAPTVLALLLAAEAHADPDKVIVLDLRSGDEAALGVAAALDPLLASEVGRAAGMAAITQADLRSLLATDTLQQLAGCADDAACASMSLAAAGPAKVVSGSVQRLETTFVLALSLIDAKAGRVERRVTRTHAGGASGLIPELRSAVEELLAGYGFKADHPPVAQARAEGNVEVGAPASLDASASYDPDSQALTFHWRQLAGPPATIDQPTQAVTSVAIPAGGTYRFGVVVSDGRLSSPESEVTIVARPPPAVRVELGASALFGVQAIAESSVIRFQERVLRHYEGTLAVPVAPRTSITLGVGLQHLTTNPESQGSDASVTLLGLMARAGARYLWNLGALAAGVGGEVILSRGYFAASSTDSGALEEDGWHRALLAGGGLHALADVPLWAGCSFVVRAGVRYQRELSTPFAFEPRLSLRLTRPDGAFVASGFDAGAGLTYAW